MCADPFSILTLASTALSVGGAVVQGQQAAQNAEMQAKAIDQQKQAQANADAYEAQQEKRRQELAMSNARAQVGASGVGFSGSPTEVLTANAGQNQMDIDAIRYGSTLKQNSLTTQAAITRYGGKQARTASYINAGSNFVSGLSSLYDPNRAVRFGQSAFA
jgi:hypothetical protein